MERGSSTRDGRTWVSNECYPLVYFKRHSQVYVVVRVDEFLCLGPWAELEPLYCTLKKIDDLKRTMTRGGSRGQVLESGGKGV